MRVVPSNTIYLVDGNMKPDPGFDGGKTLNEYLEMAEARGVYALRGRCRYDGSCGSSCSGGDCNGIIQASKEVSAPPTVDLERVAARVAKEHPDWLDERLERAEGDYRLFLMCVAAKGGPLTPSEDVDTMWHAHILHTQDYMQFCDAYFGHYMHHLPY